jgi:serine protease Do
VPPLDESHEPCPHCATPIALTARRCPACKASALVGVSLAAGVADARLRYQIARQLAALGPPMPGFIELQQALARPAPRIVQDATRAMAARVQGALAEHGLVGEEEAAPPPMTLRPWLLGAAALLALSLGTWLAKPSPPAAGQVPAAPSATSPPATLLPAAATAGPRNPQGIQVTLEQIKQRSLPSTVSLRCAGWMGAGFFVGEEIILTNAHVLCRDGQIEIVGYGGKRMKGSTLLSDEDLDFGVVRVLDAGIPPLPLGDAGSLMLGDEVALMGSPDGHDFTTTSGSVSDFTSLFGTTYIQVRAPVRPGNSGGPMLDAQGRVVGIVSLKHKAKEGIGWVLPINYAYQRASPFFPIPPDADSDGFKALLAKGVEAESRTQLEVGQAMKLPALVAFREDHAVLVRLADSEPMAENVVFHGTFRSNDVCRVDSRVYRWLLTDMKLTDNARVQSWLQRNTFDKRVYVGEAALDFGRCSPHPDTLVLEAADPKMERITIGY